MTFRASVNLQAIGPQVEAKKKMYMQTNAIEALCAPRFLENTVPSAVWPVVVVPRTATSSWLTVIPTAKANINAVQHEKKYLLTSPEKKRSTTPFINSVKTRKGGGCVH